MMVEKLSKRKTSQSIINFNLLDIVYGMICVNNTCPETFSKP